MIQASVFGKTAAGETVHAFKLKDGANEATILSLGGIVQSLKIAGSDGNPVDVVLGYNDVASYEQNGGYLGALIGRVGNRIEKGHLVIDGEEYKLFCNDRGNHLHGGKRGFDKKIWNYVFEGKDGNILALSTISPDGEENYPGNVRVEVRYTFVNGELKIDYLAMSDKKTALSLTNHAYFNLDGEGSGHVLDTFLRIDADRITPTDETLIPHGDFKDVTGTPFDFRKGMRIGEKIFDDEDDDLRYGDGYDINFVCNKPAGTYAKIAEAEGARSGIVMEVYTDLPAVQLYTGNGLNQRGKTGYYNRNYGFCLETQCIPNAVNCPAYAQLGDPIIERSRIYHTVTTYKLSLNR